MSADRTANNSRADMLRRRRANTSQQRVDQTRRSASVTRPVKSTPVITRSSPYTTPLHQTNKSRVRRQYYYSLGATGAEVRLPALPMMNPGWRLLSLSIVIIFSVALYLLCFSDRFEVEQIEANGIQRVTVADLEAALKVSGTSIVAFNPVEAKETLAAAFPELTDIKINVGLPAKVSITAAERQPVISWQSGDQVFWIDADGYILPQRGEAANKLLNIQSDSIPPLLPIVVETEEETEKDAKNETETAQSITPVTIWGRQAEPSLLKVANQLAFQIHEDSILVYNSYNGLGWKDPRGWDVYIGADMQDFQTKMVLYENIVNRLSQEGIQPNYISVEHLNAPFYK